MNARDVRREFREGWQSILRLRPELVNDLPAKREAFALFVDSLHRGGSISDRVAHNVTMPGDRP